MRRKNVTPGPNRASAFLLIAVAIPTFGLILRVIVEASPTTEAQSKVTRSPAPAPSRDLSTRGDSAGQREERQAAAEVLPFLEKVKRWRVDPVRSEADYLYGEAKSLSDKFATTRFGPELDRIKQELKVHLEARVYR